mgnify:CR=1 FL=1
MELTWNLWLWVRFPSGPLIRISRNPAFMRGCGVLIFWRNRIPDWQTQHYPVHFYYREYKKQRRTLMKKRGDYLKKAYYHLMKIEQKKNKILGVENYGEINAELNRKFERRVFWFQRSLCWRWLPLRRRRFLPPVRKRAGRSDRVSLPGRWQHRGIKMNLFA